MTFKQKREELLAYLSDHGWEVTIIGRGAKVLKKPYATRGDHRLDFHTQAIYLDGYSLISDMRQVDGPGLVQLVER